MGQFGDIENRNLRAANKAQNAVMIEQNARIIMLLERQVELLEWFSQVIHRRESRTAAETGTPAPPETAT